MRESREEQVGVGEKVRIGGAEHAVVEAGVAGQLRMNRGHRCPGVAGRGQRTDLELGVASQQAQ